MKRSSALLLVGAVVVVGGGALLFATRKAPGAVHNVIAGRRYAFTYQLPRAVEQGEALAVMRRTDPLAQVQMLSPKVLQVVSVANATGLIGDLQAPNGLIFRLLAFDDLGPAQGGR